MAQQPDYLEQNASRILEVIPHAMHAIRSELRRGAVADLTVPQMRILIHLSRGVRNNGQLAEHQGVSVAAMSRMVDYLVRRGLVERTESEKDRRETILRLTGDGAEKLAVHVASVRTTIAARVAQLDPRAREALTVGLQALEELFS